MSENVTFSTYKLTTGELEAIVSCQQETVEANTPTGYGRVDGAWNATLYWVNGGVAVEKQPMNPTVTGAVISNLPIPCTVQVETAFYQVDDGVFEFSSPLPGPYKCIISAVPYLTTEVTLP